MATNIKNTETTASTAPGRSGTFTTTPLSGAPKANKPAGNQVMLFDRSNYMWMAGGVGLMLIGLFLMAGGKSADPHQFNYDEIYSFQRITLAPIVIMIGMIVEIYAIMKKPLSAAEAV